MAHEEKAVEKVEVTQEHRDQVKAGYVVYVGGYSAHTEAELDLVEAKLKGEKGTGLNEPATEGPVGQTPVDEANPANPSPANAASPNPASPDPQNPGVPESDGLGDHTVAQLKEIAEKEDVDLTGHARKEEIVEAIRTKRAAAQAATVNAEDGS